MQNNTVLLLGLGAAALYFLSRQNAAAAPYGGLPAGAMNPGGLPGGANAWWQQPASQLLQQMVYYPYNASPAGSPTPQSGSQMAWPTSASI